MHAPSPTPLPFAPSTAPVTFALGAYDHLPAHLPVVHLVAAHLGGAANDDGRAPRFVLAGRPSHARSIAR